MVDNKKEFDIERYYKALSRVFKGGSPIVRHRIANKINPPGLPGTPVGTAKAFLKATTNLYASQMASYGLYSRLARYSDYAEMDSFSIVSSAMDIYSDETCTKNEDGNIVSIHSSDSSTRKILESLFYDVLNIDFNLWTWVRNLVKYGDQFLMIDHHPDYGVLGLIPMPVNETEREEGYDQKDPMAYRFRWITQGNRTLEPWQVAHFRIMGNDNFFPYGCAVIEAARRTWRQVVLLEDAIMVYRIVRSPERRVFYIDVGGIDPNDVPQFIEKVKTQLKRNSVVDQTKGSLDLRFAPMTITDDYYLPVRGDMTTTRIESLPGGQYVGDIDDLNYHRDKLFAALKIPKSYLGYEGDISNKAALTQEDINFARTIARIQNIIIAELNKIAVIHLYSIGYRNEDLLNFDISLTSPSIISEIQRLELWRTRFEVAASAAEGTFDRNFTYKKLFKLTEEEIEAIEEGKRKDRLFDLELEAMQPAQVPVEPGMESNEELGGEIPGQEIPAEEATGEVPTEEPTVSPEPAGERPITVDSVQREGRPLEGKDPNQQRSIPNELKGKKKRRKDDYIKRPSSLLKHAFASKKNALDPLDDITNQRRTISSPFGESKKILAEIFDELGNRDEKAFEDLIFKSKMSQFVRLTEQLDKAEAFRKKEVPTEDVSENKEKEDGEVKDT